MAQSDGIILSFMVMGGDNVAADFRTIWLRRDAGRVRAWPAPAEAAPRCRNTGSFDAWMAAFKKEALAQGISQRTISAALDGVTFDPGHHPPRQRAGRVPAELPAVRRPHDRRRAAIRTG